jgi:hypothetical protein
MHGARRWAAAAALGLVAAGCERGVIVIGEPPVAAGGAAGVVATDLRLDLAALEGEAVVHVGPGTGAVALEVPGLSVREVVSADGPVEVDEADGTLTVDAAGASFTVRYGFLAQERYRGWIPSRGLTFLWPSFCGNLFPCQPDPAHGQRYTLEVVGAPDGWTVVAPAVIPADAPAYMPAVAVGAFERRDLGQTSAGTSVSVWYPPALADGAARGTANLVGVFDFLERTYGPYRFGDEVGSVAADWRPNATGGMEHHPFWHVGFADFDDEEVHAHEAAHGWFGNGVRIACWEDFVLSEGTVSYISARALEAHGVDVWPEFGCLLRYDCFAPGGANAMVLPDQTCGEIDLLTHPIWSTATYMKGAFFFREVADVIGAGAVDEVIAAFYAEHAGGAARMASLVAALRSAAGPAAARVDEAEQRWLRTEVCPEEVRSLCPQP